MDQSVRDLPEEELRVTTWRCLDCGAFTSTEEALLTSEGPGDRDASAL